MMATSWGYPSARKQTKKSFGYKLGPIIGLGTYGEVRYADRLDGGAPVAIKIVDLSKFEEDAAEMMTKEIKILQSLDHPQVIKLVEVLEDVPHKGSWCDSCACSELKSTFNGTCANCQHSTCDHVEETEFRNVLMIIQELAAGGELFGLLTQGAFPEPLARFYFKQLISGLEHCHSRGVVHRDLKPENLVLDASFNLKIVDFGLAAINRKSKGGVHHSGVGSEPYTAPEVYYNKELYNSQGYRGEPADVWSCAVILYVMLKGSPPFRRPLLKSIGNSPRLRRCPHFSALMRGKGYNKISTGAKEFLKKLFVIDPNKRMTIKDIKGDPWFKGPTPTPSQVARMVKHKAREVWMEQLKPEMAEVLEKFAGVSEEKDDKDDCESITPRDHCTTTPMGIPQRPTLSPSNSYISTPPKSTYIDSSPPFMPSASPAFSPLGTPTGTPSTPSHMPSPSPVFQQLPAIFNLACHTSSPVTTTQDANKLATVVALKSKRTSIGFNPPQLSSSTQGTAASRANSVNQTLNSIQGASSMLVDSSRDEKSPPSRFIPFAGIKLSMLQLDEEGSNNSKIACTAPQQQSPPQHIFKKSPNDEKEIEASRNEQDDLGTDMGGKFAVHTKLVTNGSMKELVCLLAAHFSHSPSMENMDCVFDEGDIDQTTLHVSGTYTHYNLASKIDIINESQHRRVLLFRRIQGNSLAFQRFFIETSQAIWNR